MPTSMIATISNVVATGRRMKGREGLIDRPRGAFARRLKAASAKRFGSLREAPALAALPFARLRPLWLRRPLACHLRVRRPRRAWAGRGLRLSVVARAIRRSVVRLL